jgi:hypothetical protein
MTILTKGMGVIKYLKSKKSPFKNPPYKAHKRNIESAKMFERTKKQGVTDRNVKSKEVFNLIKGLRKGKKDLKSGWGAHLKRRSRVFKEGQERHKALDIKEGKK